MVHSGAHAQTVSRHHTMGCAGCVVLVLDLHNKHQACPSLKFSILSLTPALCLALAPFLRPTQMRQSESDLSPDYNLYMDFPGRQRFCGSSVLSYSEGNPGADGEQGEVVKLILIPIPD